MSGHSKWATTKHRKGAVDAARAKVFAKLIRQIEVAAREGGSDMTANASLRTMYTKAREASVPIDTIERAIKRGSGELEGVRYESISYEGYAPDGVAVIVECLSDNRNRTGAEIRNLFSRNGGAMAEPRRGQLAVRTQGRHRRAADPRRGADPRGGHGGRRRGPDRRGRAVDGDQRSVRPGGGAGPRSRRPAWSPAPPSCRWSRRTTVEVASEAEAKRVLRLIEALDDHDDVQNVYANFDIPDEIMAAYEG